MDLVRFLNGEPVASSNAPEVLIWNSIATAERSAVDSSNIVSINLSQHLDKLQAGSNVLAIQGLNWSSGDSDFLIEPALITSGTAATPRYFLEPSPGEPNGEGVFGFVSDVAATHERGFFSEPFSLELHTATPEATIRYTTDSSTPTRANGTLYEGPLTVSSTTTLRFAAFKDGFDPSVIETQTYIFLDDVFGAGSYASIDISHANDQWSGLQLRNGPRRSLTAQGGRVRCMTH